MARRPLRIFSWNVNGLRAAERKGFSQWMQQTAPDVVGVQEVRAEVEQIPTGLTCQPGYRSHFVVAKRRGYSGVGLWVRHGARSRSPSPRIGPLLLDQSAHPESIDDEGRLQMLTWGNLRVVNGYFPNGDGKNRDNSRVPYKLRFYRRLLDELEPLKARGLPILVMGDWNTAHRPIDLARPTQNKTTSGFLEEERIAFDEWLDRGWIDTFRRLHPVPDPFALPKRGGKELPPGGGHFTWWSQRGGVRERNVGWRIDYVLASPGALPYLTDARIHPEVPGSDHCPISVALERSVLD